MDKQTKPSTTIAVVVFYLMFGWAALVVLGGIGFIILNLIKAFL